MPAIGILGGMGPQASNKLYELLIEGTRAYSPAAKNSDYPEIIVLSIPLPNIISDTAQLEAARTMMLERTMLLEQAGCIVNGIACNTTHVLLPEMQQATSVPFLPIPKLVAEYAEASGYSRIGLLATPTTLQSTMFDDALEGIAGIIRPSDDIALEVERYIYRRLHSTLPATDQQNFKKLVADFMIDKNLDAVILGCTELPLIYGDNSNQPEIIDTIQLLSEALLAAYYKKINDKN